MARSVGVTGKHQLPLGHEMFVCIHPPTVQKLVGYTRKCVARTNTVNRQES